MLQYLLTQHLDLISVAYVDISKLFTFQDH